MTHPKNKHQDTSDIGAVDRDRTDDLGINSPTLYRLSYDGLGIGET